MKTATFPPLRVDSELRKSAESVLERGESLSSFVEQSIRSSVRSRRTQAEFIARGLASRDEARRTDKYTPPLRSLRTWIDVLRRRRRNQSGTDERRRSVHEVRPRGPAPALSFPRG